MINYDLPTSIFIDGKEYAIRNRGDYRVILDAISSLNNKKMDEREKVIVALMIFYGEDNIPENGQAAVDEMMRFINLGEEVKEEEKKPPLMDWDQDFLLIVPPLNKVLGFEIRSVPYLHWWTCIGGYQEIPDDNTYSAVVKIRKKRQNGEKLDKAEQRFFSEHKEIVLLKKSLSDADLDFLYADD